MTAPRHKTKISAISLLIAVNVFDIDLKGISVSWLEDIRLHDPLGHGCF